MNGRDRSGPSADSLQPTTLARRRPLTAADASAAPVSQDCLEAIHLAPGSSGHSPYSSRSGRLQTASGYQLEAGTCCHRSLEGDSIGLQADRNPSHEPSNDVTQSETSLQGIRSTCCEGGHGPHGVIRMGVGAPKPCCDGLASPGRGVCGQILTSAAQFMEHELDRRGEESGGVRGRYPYCSCEERTAFARCLRGRQAPMWRGSMKSNRQGKVSVPLGTRHSGVDGTSGTEGVQTAARRQHAQTRGESSAEGA